MKAYRYHHSNRYAGVVAHTGRFGSTLVGGMIIDDPGPQSPIVWVFVFRETKTVAVRRTMLDAVSLEKARLV